MIIRGFDGGWPELNDGYVYSNTVSKQSCIGLSLVDYLLSEWPSSGSRDEWEQRLQDEQVTINGRAMPSSTSLKGNDKVVYHRPPYSEPLCPDYLEVLYQDEDILAVNKPPGIQVLPRGPFLQRTALEILKRYASRADLPTPAPVHRIGRGTSGILISALSPRAKRMLAEAMIRSTVDSKSADGQRSLKKVYRCRVQGLIKDDQGTIDAAIGPIAHSGVIDGLHAALTEEQGGKASLSRFTVLHRDEGTSTSLVAVEIFTGRPHQIRIHMAFIGHPLVGDPLYGAGGVPMCHEAGRSTADQGDLVGGGGGVRGDAVQVMPGDIGYLLHSHILELPLPSGAATGLARWPRASKVEGKEGWLHLQAPLPQDLKTPYEIQEAQ